jgi:hypothetical protein
MGATNAIVGHRCEHAGLQLPRVGGKPVFPICEYEQLRRHGLFGGLKSVSASGAALRMAENLLHAGLVEFAGGEPAQNNVGIAVHVS